MGCWHGLLAWALAALPQGQALTGLLPPQVTPTRAGQAERLAPDARLARQGLVGC